MYELTFDSEAISFLEKAEKVIAKRIWNKLQSTKENPHRYFERLSERQDYKLRVGDYRALADIDDQNKRIFVSLIGHRKNVYKK
jgi:mRNA interferase RelE/StbE|tara:strand:- start:82 stop:333 length:252 start_codon:yes stop_codon:yes gene_type:complete